MNISSLIIARKIGFIQEQAMNEKQILINQLMYQLDIENHKKELRWGYGRLLELAPDDGPDGGIGLRSKWIAHMDKLNEAILASDVLLVDELVKGAARGLGALERSAVELGYVPYDPVFWEVPMDDGTVYRVVRHTGQAEGLSGKQGGPVISLMELVRVYHARHQSVFKSHPMDEKKGEYVASNKPMNEPLNF